MLYSDLKVYLNTQLPRPNLSFLWSEEDNRKFFNFLRKKFPKHYYQKEEGKAEIKHAFKEYFESVGYVVCQLREKQVLLKVFPYKIEPKQSVNLDALIKILYDNQELIQDNYKKNKNQILFPKEFKQKIFEFTELIENEEINKKELIKYSIRKFLELNESDIVIIKEESIFIKLLSNIKKKHISLEEQETIANRYNGIEEDELISFYTESFSQEENKNFFYLVAKVFVDVYFNEQKIDNAEYEKNVFYYIQDIIIDQLNTTFDFNETFFRGFSGYIFRIHFQEVFGHITDFILYEVAMSNTHVSDFLKYYSLNIIVVNGIKYKVPTLEADNGLKWNVISIMSVAKVYMKVMRSVEDLTEDMYDIDDDLYSMFIADSSPVEYNNELLKFQNEITEDIAFEIKELKSFSDKYDSSNNSTEKKEMKIIMQDIKDDLIDFKTKRDNIAAKMLDKSVISEYRALEKEMEECIRQIKAEERILKQNEESYTSVKKTLTKALISKKKRI